MKDDPSPPSPSESRKWFAQRVVALGDDLLIHAEDVRTDLLLLQNPFPNPAEYRQALTRIIDQFGQLIRQTTVGQELDRALAGWRKHKFRSLMVDRQDLRIAFRIAGHRVEVLGFGHRDEPWDFYDFIQVRAQSWAEGSRDTPAPLRPPGAGER